MGKKREYLIARESEGGGGSSFDENCFRPRLQIQSTFSGRLFINSSFNLAVSFDLKGEDTDILEDFLEWNLGNRTYKGEKYFVNHT